MTQNDIPLRNTQQSTEYNPNGPTMTIEKALRVIGYTIIVAQFLIIFTILVFFPEFII